MAEEFQAHRLSVAGGVEDRMRWLRTLCPDESVADRQRWAEEPGDKKVHTSHFRNRDKFWTTGGKGAAQLRLRTKDASTAW